MTTISLKQPKPIAGNMPVSILLTLVILIVITPTGNAWDCNHGIWHWAQCNCGDYYWHCYGNCWNNNAGNYYDCSANGTIILI